MSWDECSAILKAHNHACSANNTNVNGTNNNKSTVAGSPTTVNVANGADGNNTHQVNTTNQTAKCNVQRKHTQHQRFQMGLPKQDQCDGTMYHSIDAVVRHHVSQQESENKVPGALIDGGANGGLLGEDVCILEHMPNGFANVTGVTSNEVANLKLLL